MAAIARPSTSGGLSTRGPTSKDDLYFTHHTNSSSRTMNHPSATSYMQSNKRVSRDDLYIRNHMASMARFHVPVAAPGRGIAAAAGASTGTLTPEHSPSYYPEAKEVSLPIRMQTPESMTSGDIPIGMALGSPTLPSVSAPTRWQAQFPPASPATTVGSKTGAAVAAVSGTPMAASSSSTTPAAAPSLGRKKTNGRKKLFGLFGGGGKKQQQQHAEETDSNYSNSGSGQEAELARGLRLGQGISVTTKTYTEIIPVRAKQSPPPKTPTRSNTQADRKGPMHKPIMLRSNTMPVDEEAKWRNASNKPAGSSAPPIKMPPMPLPRLDVTIPDTKLERYSVMFSDVLNPRAGGGGGGGSGTQHEPAASLLARRQATLERLKTINDRIQEQVLQEEEREKETTTTTTRPPPRRATSPQPMPSPRLSVFPAPPTTNTRVVRSNTSPGRLPSPTQGTFDVRPPPSIPLQQQRQKRLNRPRLDVPNPFEMNPPRDQSWQQQPPTQPLPIPPQRPPPPRQQRQEPIYPTDTSFHFGPDQSGLILDSPTSIDDSTAAAAHHEEILISQPFRPTLHEPQWHMVSPSSNTTRTNTTAASSSTKSRSRSTSSATTHATKTSADLDNDRGGGDVVVDLPADPAAVALQNAVEVSIARQISISRQQRNLLRPLQTRRGGAGGGIVDGSGSSPSPLIVNPVTSPKGYVKEVSAGTPTLVHSGNSPVPAEHRKSSWVVLESD